jgi:hypothetical protein
LLHTQLWKITVLAYWWTTIVGIWLETLLSAYQCAVLSPEQMSGVLSISTNKVGTAYFEIMGSEGVATRILKHRIFMDL